MYKNFKGFDIPVGLNSYLCMKDLMIGYGTKELIQDYLYVLGDPGDYSLSSQEFGAIQKKVIKNENLIIKMDVLGYKQWSLRNYYMLRGSCRVKVLFDEGKEEAHAFIEVGSLFSLIQMCGIDENGYINKGVSLISSDRYWDTEFIPIITGSTEYYLRKDIARIWNTKTLTTKLKPGYLYINRNKELYICISDNIKSNFGFNINFYFYSRQPIYRKILVKVTNMDFRVFNSTKELIQDVKGCGLYTPRVFSGKEIMKAVEATEMQDIIHDKEIVASFSGGFYLFDDTWKDPVIAKEVLKQIRTDYLPSSIPKSLIEDLKNV